ncbi:MAG: molybdenum cofactor biosynthesis protein MoaE [Chiayiivirga sp.]|jgi:molybdopterin synthase catalytic subunit|uniref:molybdenum cofactor biosynthesis protein MoaE n=1 Tax=Chiayiivirga sp. TaxID=2041042 RepID=UPI0025BC91D8|nr:molybdenum cofactor biosynthesis protein MoaE [Chiayiivirga sp.]MCI1710189.1 molybdenum cofactor biosynthesis protein MoaE [Chiayiivirga sp.]MCI1729010.1 molybdenum cofactor biosynthesis protein MoaE [Chiayiivirga sp.]
MSRFRLRDSRIDGDALRRELQATAAGGFCSFEGWVRDEHRGRAVRRLDYQAYEVLAGREAERILDEARERFAIIDARCEHRVGTLEPGDVAVWIGVSAAHRDAAFAACRYLIDEIKQRVPIWKREHYAEGDSGWIHPESP